MRVKTEGEEECELERERVRQADRQAGIQTYIK